MEDNDFIDLLETFVSNQKKIIHMMIELRQSLNEHLVDMDAQDASDKCIELESDDEDTYVELKKLLPTKDDNTPHKQRVKNVKENTKAYYKEYYKNNKNKYKKYYDENKQKYKEYYEKNKERCSEYARKRYRMKHAKEQNAE